MDLILEKALRFSRAKFDSYVKAGEKMAAKCIQTLPIGSEFIGPPKKLCMRSLAWIEQTRSKPSKLPGKYEEIYPARTGKRVPPRTSDGGIPWQFRAFYGGMRFTEEAAFVLTIPRGRVCGEGSVITPDDQLLGDISRELMVGGDQRKHSVFSHWKLPKLTFTPGTVAVLAVASANCYYHWMFDLLPRIHLLRLSDKGSDGIDKFITNRILHKFQTETLDVLGVSPPRIMECGEAFFHIRADNVIASSVIREVPPKWVCDFLRTELMPKIVQDRPGTRKRLYISRADARTRRVVNERELIDFLSGFGFSTVTLSGRSVSEQATLCGSADLVVAAHGSGLTNIVFCDPGTKVIELFSPTCVNPCYWALSDALGHEYLCLFGDGQLPPEPPKGMDAERWFYSFVDSDKKYGRNIFVNIESLRHLLKSVL